MEDWIEAIIGDYLQGDTLQVRSSSAQTDGQPEDNFPSVPDMFISKFSVSVGAPEKRRRSLHPY
jgi:hypothetical protein